jgi:DNA (cytosine-5)-methyltransferase 1
LSDPVPRVSSVTGALTVVDLFAGCGGLTQGFLEAGASRSDGRCYEVAAAVEADLAAAATYAANFGRDAVWAGRIEDWPEKDRPRADVVVGGPPCQGFSTLGKQNPGDPRNSLWREYARALSAIAPDYFVIENVAAFFRSPQWEILQTETSGGALSNYEIQPYLLNAAQFGVPQIRKRAVIIGRRAGRVAVPDPVGAHTDPATWSTVGTALAKLPRRVDPRRTDLPTQLFEFHGRDVPGSFKTSDLHVTRKLTPISLARFSYIPPGGNRTDIPDELLAPCWRKHTSGSMDVMGRLRWSRPSVTIRTEFVKPEKGRYLHPSEDRPLTHAEAALLQTFPLDYQWCGAKFSIARQIGNAVPPLMARSLGNLIADQYR